MKRLLLSLSFIISYLSFSPAGAQGWPADYSGVMLQGFYWDGYADAQWNRLEKQVDNLSTTFDLVWLPQSGNCGGQSMGYDDLYWFPGHYDSSFGTEDELRSLINTFKAKGIGTIADVVINHRKNVSTWTDFPAETYKGVTYQLTYNDICADDEAARNGQKVGSNQDTGEGWDGMRDLDHKSTNVQTNVKAYLHMLLEDLGYVGFRYDMVKGYAATYTKMYNEDSKPLFSVGECWDSSNTIKNWIDGTGKTSAAFDFQFRYTVRNAANNGDWSKLAAQNDGNWPLVSSNFNSGSYRQYAVTFVENHDTEFRSSFAQQDPIRKDTLAANAYLLAMPGTPCVFLKHWQSYKQEIANMVAVRKAVGITNVSIPVTMATNKDYYVIQVAGSGEKKLLCVVGSKANSYTPNSDAWKKVISGYHYVYYVSGIEPSAITLPELKIDEEQQDDDYNVPSFCTVDEGEICAFFEAPKAWGSQIFTWAWMEGGDGKDYLGTGWPGVAATLLGTADNGNKVFKWTSAKATAPDYIIFSSGGSQTADLAFQNGGYYNIDGLKASVGVNKYKLMYVVDGQTYKTFNMEYGAIITPEPAPTKEGYTFSGWSEIPATMPAHDVTITGTFTLNKYKLTYVVDGQTYKTYDVEFGAAITPEAAPIKEGCTFSGWSEIPATMPAHDVTVTGTFTVNKYKLTYIVDGETYKTYDVEFGAAITPEAEPIKEGYTFSGWSEIPATMPAHDVTVTGTFTVNKYKLTYVVDGETYKTYEMEYGANITPEPAPTKEGYTFSGWSEIPATMPAHDVTVTGTFTVNKYKLTYVVDGQTYKTYDVEFGAAITPEAEPIKEGYTFSGWSEIPASMPAHDVTITGSFTVNKYKLTYVVDEQVYKTYDVEFGAAITPEAEPTKEGYTFSGWSEIPVTMPAYDVTVTGTFTKGSYKLIYVVDGEVYKTIGYDFGDVITPESEPTRVGYTFSGWSEIPATMPAHDVTVTGTFTVNKYKLTYIVDGQTYKTYEVEFGAVITPEPAPTKEGYTFSGWNEIPATMPAHDVTVTGTFTVNKYKLTYVVDGETYRTYDLDYGTVITPEPAPTKEGYIFSGWSNIPATMPAHDVTVTGTFTVNKYKLTYVVDGQTYKTYDLDYGTTITPEPAPSKEGYTFSGWSEIPATMPAHNVTVTGSFTKGNYKLTYMVDGEVYKTVGYDYGDVITPEPAPEKEGYTFSGWNNLPATMPAHDVTVTGTFTVNKYQLTYIVDGEEYKTYEVEYGATITPEPEPVKEGHIFSGWNGLPEVMPAHAVVVTGTFTKAKYMLTYMVNGEVYKSMELEFGAEITPEPPIELEGHTFSGWSSIPATMPAHDVTITATLTVNKYILTYILDGKEYKTMEVEYGSPITPEPNPEKEGYTFSGWSEIPATMPAKLVIVTGTFSINSYMLTYMIGDEVYKLVTYEYGAAITPEPQPEGDYVSFEWVGVPETMPAHDVTVTAVYETGIAEIVMMAQQGQVHIYSPNGKRQNKLQKGLNIVVMQDGTTKKVVVK